MRRGIVDFGATYGSRIVVLAITLASQSVLAWTLGAAGRGSLAVCLTFATCLAEVFSAGTDISVTYFVSSKKLTVFEGFSCALIFAGIGSLVAMSVGWVAIQLPVAYFEKASHEAFLLSLLLIPLTQFSQNLQLLLTALHLFKSYAAICVLQGFVQLLLTFLLVWTFKFGVGGALIANIIAVLLTALLSLLALRKTCHVRWARPSLMQLKGVLSHGIRQYIAKMGGMANTQAGTIFLAFVATEQEIGWFAIASRMTVLVLMFPHALNTVLLPKISEDEAGRKHLVARAMRVSLVVCGFIFLILALFGDIIIPVLFSREFLPAVQLLRILAIGGVCFCIGKLLLTYLIGIGRPGMGSSAVVAGVTLNLVALLWLTPMIGVSGAAWAMTANYVLSTTILMCVFLHYSGLKLREVARFRLADWY